MFNEWEFTVILLGLGFAALFAIEWLAERRGVNMGDVVNLGCTTSNEIPADKVLVAAIGELDAVVVLGYKKGSKEEYFAASFPTKEATLWLLERCKRQVLALETD